jgi:hypothetical protein
MPALFFCRMMIGPTGLFESLNQGAFSLVLRVHFLFLANNELLPARIDQASRQDLLWFFRHI